MHIKKNIYKIISSILAIATILTSMNVSVLAEEFGIIEERDADESLSGEIGFDREYISPGYMIGTSLVGTAGNASANRQKVVDVLTAELTNFGHGHTMYTYDNPNGYNWCAYFACWCVHQAGFDSSVFPYKDGSTNSIIRWFADRGRWHDRLNAYSYYHPRGGKWFGKKDDGYMPKPGDFAAVENSRKKDSGEQGDPSDKGAPDHTAMVVGIDSNYIYTIEGNTGSPATVARRTYHRSSLYRVGSSSIYIVGFGEPDYGTDIIDDISFSEASTTLKVGRSHSIDFSFSGSDLHSIEFGTEDGFVANANLVNISWENGKGTLEITGIRSGTTNAFIQFKNSAGNVVIKKTISVKVTAEEDATITHSTSSISIYEGDIENLVIGWTGSEVAQVYPEISIEGIVGCEWAFTDSFNRTATLSFTGLKAGTATYTTKLKDSSGRVLVQKSVNITVKKMPNISYSESSITVKSGTSQRIDFSFSGDDLYTVECGTDDGSVANANLADISWENGEGTLEINGIRSGTTNAFIQFKNSAGNVILKKPISVRVTVGEAATITHSTSSISIYEGDTANLVIEWTGSEVAQLYPELSKDEIVDCEWAYTDIANRMATLTFVGLKAGTVTYTTILKDSNGEIVAQKSINITVNAKIDADVILLRDNVDVKVGKSTLVGLLWEGTNVKDVVITIADRTIVSAFLYNKSESSKAGSVMINGLKEGTTSVRVNAINEDNRVLAYKDITVNVSKEAFKVLFDINGYGEAPLAITDVENGSTIIEPIEPMVEGYIFGGWYKESACITEWNFAEDKVTSNVTLYAKWTKIESEAAKYTVIFDVNGGVGTYTSQSIVEGGYVERPRTNPVKNGCEFRYWAVIDSESITEYNFELPVTKNITLYAVYENIDQAVPFEYNVNNDGKTITITGYTGEESGDLIIPNIIDDYIVTNIGWNAFIYCNGFKGSLILPSTLQSIGRHAFYYCYGFTGDLVIPDSVTEIEEEAFEGCSGFTGRLYLSESLRIIGDGAFSYCKGFTGELKLPTNLTQIGDSAFDNCVGLSGDLVIPSTVTKLSYFSFLGCTGITRFENNSGKLLRLPGNDVYLWKNIDTEEYLEEITNGVVIREDKNIDRYTVTFDANGHGVPPLAISVMENGYIIHTPDEPLAEGYEFKGWYKDPSCTTEWDFSNDVVVADITLYAKWIKKAENKNENELAHVHNWDIKYTVDKAPTCEEPGEKSIHCTTCTEKKDVTVIEVIGHTWDEGEITKASTYTEKGIKTYTCKNDSSHIKTIEIPNLDVLGDILIEDIDSFTESDILSDKIKLVGIEDAEYTGSKVTFDIRVYKGTRLLIEGIDYTLKYTNNKEACTDLSSSTAPTVTLVGKGTYKNEIVEPVKFKINPVDISNLKASNDTVAVDNWLYRPVPTLTINEKKLKANKDYEIVYDATHKNGFIETGTYNVILKGINNYTGSVISTFKIVDTAKYSLMSKATVSGYRKSFKYDGTAKEQDPKKLTVKIGNDLLSLNTDYTVECVNNVETGIASMIIKAVEGSDKYVGEKVISYKITGTPISKAKATFDGKNIFYTGKTIKPVVTVALKDGIKLTEGADYTITYQKNVNVGTAAIIIKGKGAYSGTVKKSFKIKPVTLTNNTNITATTVGKAVKNAKGKYEIELAVKNGEKTLLKGSDYTVSFKNNTKPGTATAIIKGKGNYKKTTTVSFEITE